MNTLNSQLEKFKKETGFMLDVRNGKPYFSGRIDLEGTAITSLPDNLTVGCYLYLANTAITSLPNNLTVGGSLHLEGTAITSLPNNLTVEGSLHLKDTAITMLPDDLVVGGSLHLKGSAVATLPANFTIGGALYLKGSAITSLPDNLTIGRCLYLKGSAITSLPDNLTVGQSLYLKGTAISSLPDNLTVGDSIYFKDTNITDTSKVNYNIPNFFEWRNSEYIKVDGVFSKVISHKGNLYKVCIIGLEEEKEQYVVTNGGRKWSYGYTLEKAKRDLIHKISNRNKSRYESLTLDSTLTAEEAIEAYRVITKVCSSETKMFVKYRLTERKDNYTVAEIINLTKGEYRSEIFKDFFNK